MPERRLFRAVYFALALSLAGCAGNESSSESSVPMPLLGGQMQSGFGGERPVPVYLPPGFESGQARGLLLMLHGFGVDGPLQEAYLRLLPEAARRQLVYVAPNGRINGAGQRFWNATQACCDFEKRGPDDVAYLLGLIEEIQARLHLDDSPVYLLGYSNGAFMAQRLGCEAADRFRAVVSIAGAIDDQGCDPQAPLRFLQVHGDLDLTILYTGGTWFGEAYPGAEATAQAWARYNGCANPGQPAGRRNLDAVLPGSETRVQRWTGCWADTTVELWSMQGAGHVPVLGPDFSRQVIDYLLGQPTSGS